MTTSTDKKYADVTIFPDLNITIRTPAGRVYKGKVLEHPSQYQPGETWLQVQFLKGETKDDLHASALLQQHFKKSGRPGHFPPASKVEPLDVAFNRLPAAKRTVKNADVLISDLWDADGLWTLLIRPSKSDKVLYAGSALPSAAEIAHGDSKIAQHARPTRPGESADPETGTSTSQAKTLHK
jgi:hypothetical protein